jgi:hypothetical protein
LELMINIVDNPLELMTNIVALCFDWIIDLT